MSCLRSPTVHLADQGHSCRLGGHLRPATLAAYRLGAQAFGTLAATGFPPAFLVGGLPSIQSHHTGQTSESLGTLGITDADATGLDWPLTGVIPTLGPTEPRGRAAAYGWWY